MPDSNPVTHLGKYEILEELGRGGFGVVYKARDTKLDRLVALKLLRPSLLEEADFVLRFRREARAAANLSHPNIVIIHDFDNIETVYFIAMQYLEGPNLAKVIQQDAPLALERAASILEQIGSALDYAHSKGMTHRDVKPTNIIIAANGHATLTDFGLVRVASDTTFTTTASTGMGTPTYMAPEQAEPNPEAPPGPSADLYSLGVVAYEMLTGRVPFIGHTPFAILRGHTDKEPPPPSSLNSGITPAVEEVLLKFLAKTPADRYAGGVEMAVALRAAPEEDRRREALRKAVAEAAERERQGKEQERLDAERKAAEDAAERARQEEEEQRRLAAERKAAEEAEQKRLEAERLAAALAAEQARHAEQERLRLEAERKAADEAARKKRELEEAQRREAERKAADEAARKKRELEEAQRREAERKAADEAARKKRELENAQRLEAQRKAAEEAARKKRDLEEAQRLEAERKAADEAARKKREQEAAQRREAERKLAAEKARQAAAQKVIEAKQQAAPEEQTQPAPLLDTIRKRPALVIAAIAIGLLLCILLAQATAGGVGGVKATATAVPTRTVQATTTARPPATATSIPAAVPTVQPQIATTSATAAPTNTAAPSPSATPAPPTATPVPASTPTSAPTATNMPPTATRVPPTATPLVLQPPVLQEPANNVDMTNVDMRFRWAAPPGGLAADVQYQMVIVYNVSGQEQSDNLYTGTGTEAVASVSYLEGKRAQDSRFWWSVRLVNAQGQPLAGTETGRWGFIWRPKPAAPPERPTNTPVPP